jgi:hypothetical protein
MPRSGSKALAREQERWKFMPLIQLLEVLIVVGVLLWLVNRFIPMQASIKSILNGVVVIAVVLWLLNVFGLFHSLSAIHIGKGWWAGLNIAIGRYTDNVGCDEMNQKLSENRAISVRDYPPQSKRNISEL